MKTDKKVKKFIKEVEIGKQVITLIFEDKKTKEEVKIDMRVFIDMVSQEAREEVLKKIDEQIMGYKKNTYKDISNFNIEDRAIAIVVLKSLLEQLKKEGKW